MTTNRSITSGQEKQFKRFVEDAADRAFQEVAPDKDEIQRLIEQGDELQKDLIASIRRLTLTDEYADEEEKSEYGYPCGYAVKSIAEQVKILQRLFPGLEGVDESIAQRDLPAGAEGWFAIPRWSMIAPTYNEAVEKVLVALAILRGFNNYCGPLGPENLRQHDRTVKMLQQLGRQQTGDILIVPIQFGKRHAGRSIRRARVVFKASEFGLGVFSAGVALLTHPERLMAYEDLSIDCAGDEFSPDGDGEFGRAPCFSIIDGVLYLDTNWVDYAGGDCGSVSAFLPQ